MIQNQFFLVYVNFVWVFGIRFVRFFFARSHNRSNRKTDFFFERMTAENFRHCQRVFFSAVVHAHTAAIKKFGFFRILHVVCRKRVKYLAAKFIILFIFQNGNGPAGPDIKKII